MFGKIDSLLIFIFFIVTAQKCVSSQKINIAVLYESLCPDSIKFINEQLFPNWGQIVPFSINGGQEFHCQHGPMECAGNKIQTCALNSITDQNTQVQFVHCFMNSFAKNDVGQSCAAQVGINWAQIEHCYSNQQGILLQLQAESVTKSVAPKFVPTILYNEIFDQNDQDNSQNNFLGVVCHHLNKLQSGICRLT